MDLPAVIPAVNASLNAASTALITAGFLFIRRRRIAAHRACMLGAVATSALFLIGYGTQQYLSHGAHVPFGGHGFIRPVYFAMLISHSILATAVVPLVVITLIFALRGKFDRHRRWARWTYPVWYYVSVTGVLVYFFLFQWWPAPR